MNLITTKNTMGLINETPSVIRRFDESNPCTRNKLTLYNLILRFFKAKTPIISCEVTMRKAICITLLAMLTVFVSCKKEPDRVTVQHILIAFKGSIPKEDLIRNRAEAELLAKEIFERAKNGEDFDALVKEYTDDQHPGIYKISNIGIEPDKSKEEYSRARMVKAFGDTSFKLGVNNISLAEYDPETSKYGWHIIKRIE